MSCTSPITVWYGRELSSQGNRRVVFEAGLAEDGAVPFKIPCHQCMGCRIDRNSDWSLRLMQENKFHACSCFLTITYAPEFLPEHGTLVKRDVQLFMKRLRKHYPNAQIRYYLCGEYGDKNGRPHYHAIVFGVDFSEDRRPHSKNAWGDQLYSSATLDKLWGKGNCQIGKVEPSSCRYVAGYIFKKVNGKRAEEHYRRVDPVTGETWTLLPEFSLMSSRPGLGYRHYAAYGNQMYLRGSCIVNGVQVPIPKYYDRKLGQDDPLRLESIKTGRFEDAQKRKAENTPERLAVKAEIMQAKRDLYSQRDL